VQTGHDRVSEKFILGGSLFRRLCTKVYTRKPCYRKDDRAMRPEKFRESSQTSPATFPEICKGLLFRSILRMCIQKLKFVALSVPEIIGGTQKIGQSLYTPTLQFLPNF